MSLVLRRTLHFIVKVEQVSPVICFTFRVASTSEA
jgi:hypothetical protein